MTPAPTRSTRMLLLFTVFLLLQHLPSVTAHEHQHHHAHAHQHEHPHHHQHEHPHDHASCSTHKIPALLHRLLRPLHTLPPSTAALTASFLVSSASIISLLLLPLASLAGPLLLPFAAGALLTDVFHHLLPLIYSTPTAHPAPSIPRSLLLSCAIFFLLDALLRRLSGPHPHSHPHPHLAPPPTRSAAYINLAADALHNFCDGLSLGAAFLASPSAGVATTIAIILHELPQELADYAVLLRAGFSRPAALAANLLCAATALAGTMAAITAADMFENAANVFLPFAAGALLYMTFVTVIPDVLEDVIRPVGKGKDNGEIPVGFGLLLARVVLALVAAAGGVFVVGLVESVHEH